MIKYPTINISELRRIVDALLVNAEKQLGPEVHLDQDYYWDASGPNIYDMSQPVTAVEEVGSLGDSWEFLFNMRGRDIAPEGPRLMLLHVAPLLRYLADKPEPNKSFKADASGAA
jgi:hypothetical protein